LINLRKYYWRAGLILNGFDTKDGKKIIEDATYDLNILKHF
jgi:hypothetical protein